MSKYTNSRPLDQVDIEELLSRFILNLPQNELFSDRIFMHIQSAFWFYTDHLFKGEANDHLSFDQVADQLVKPLLKYLPKRFSRYQVSNKDWFYQLRQLMKGIPVYGTIILNKKRTKVLLVKNEQLTNYSFPKGKVNENETSVQCAIRETWEEIGFNCSQLISEDDYISSVDEIESKSMYIIDGVDEDYKFKTQCKGEIGGIYWVNLEEIKQNPKRQDYKQIIQYINGLMIWIDYIDKNGKRNTSKLDNQLKQSEISFTQQLRQKSSQFQIFLSTQCTDKQQPQILPQLTCYCQNPFDNFKFDQNKLNSAFD